MSGARRPVVYVFVRRPVLGAVKKRLATGIGGAAAAAFYRRCCAMALRRTGGDRRWRVVLAVTPDSAARARRAWPPAFPRLPQGRGDLGRRMERVLRMDPARPALIVGSDVPGIAARHIAQAVDALRGADFVFGPAPDGGYWLVGRAPGRPVRGLFDGVRWSGPHALADTLANTGRRRAALAATLEDVDDAEGFMRWRARGVLRASA